MNEITRILEKIEDGDPAAAAHLLPLVYEELRKLATARLAQERPGQTLQATALVHEAYLRLIGPANAQGFDNRGHFFSAAAEAMRRILIERARRRASPRHGGELIRKELDTLDLAAPESADDLLALDEALDQLAETDEKAAQLVKLRYFAGLTMAQVAQALNISPRTADRLWTYARAFLHAEIYEK
jgi:RNA polymerase sigma factor (TIGR02999 family)